ncbi:hypothetical protein K4L44_10115 [Halosquirtibacter laminarini]|uniref:Uncharacterized protein n=1 Tax=Halosquirtibacter laminarini TaxID=3374600 RepID=A0AC61NBS6_9BACT|nr:hypothetical protein K4L44_10115 [Prolixibacteraceae bacterium]
MNRIEEVTKLYHEVTGMLEIEASSLSNESTLLFQGIDRLRSLELDRIDCMYDRFHIWSYIFAALHHVIKSLWPPEKNYIRYRWMVDHHHWFISGLPFTLHDIYEGVLGKDFDLNSGTSASYFTENDPRNKFVCKLQCDKKEPDKFCEQRQKSTGLLRKRYQCVTKLSVNLFEDYSHQVSRFGSVLDAVVDNVYHQLRTSYASLFWIFRF